MLPTGTKGHPLLSRTGVTGWETGTTGVSQPGQINVFVVVLIAGSIACHQLIPLIIIARRESKCMVLTLSKNILLDKKHVLAQPLSALCILRSCEPRRATEGAD